ncbi:MAG: hypothetical protein CVU61_02030 [Deltaproteobacteria bacterium HGW-Deltaproteobacteria-19]|jgi:hypothetical protein|nr:MAG: hypothetical protein CVU61_02030 [Deltaproteobacteria bacterium HGW-Deltaproteobacteria-19]
MSSGTPKTGLARRMREWMKDRNGVFTCRQICDSLNIPPGLERGKVQSALREFHIRGELVPVQDKRIRRQPVVRYRYMPSKTFGRRPSVLRGKVLKAMRMISFHEPFAVTDIERISGARTNYIQRITCRLLEEGYLRQEGFRPHPSGNGKQPLYRIIDTNRFRLEVME